MASARHHGFKLTTLAAMLAMPIAMGSHHALANDLILEEVIVTAQKRSESVQDIPATINVLSGDTLKDFNALKFADIESLTAGLQITSLSGRSGRMSLRGISHTPVSAAEATVTTYWNQAIVDSNAVFQQMFDIQRIEVLRGPQGTLAGRTSPAGAINIHSARPNMDEVEGEVRGTFADNDGINTQVAASIPLIPGKLAVRVAGVFDESDRDEIENVITGEISGEETTAARFSLSWLPTDSLSVDLAVQYLEREIDDISALSGAPNGDAAALLDPSGVLRALDTFDRFDARVGVDGVSDHTDADYLNTSLVMEWDLESHTITSVTGYQKTESVREFDQAQGNANPDNVARRVATDDRTDLSQEIRIATDNGDSWDYMVGVYYEDSDIFFSQDNHQIPISPLAGGSALLVFPADVKRWGLFTHNQFYLTDAWTLQLGLRYQEVDVDRDMSLVAGANGISILEPGVLITQVLSDANTQYEDDSVTGQITLQYALSDNMKIYGLVGTGWRPGGITVTGSVLPEDVLLFNSEDSVSFELGFKSTLMGGTMRLSGAVFMQDFDDYISRVSALTIRGLDGALTRSGITTNGDAEVWGAELEMSANLSESWFIGGALSYTNAEFADGSTNPCNNFDANGAAIIPVGQSVANCEVGGEPIGRAADWSASINSEYRIDLGNFEGYGRALYSYTGEQFTPDLGALDTYNTFDAYLGIRSDRWHVEVFAKNLFDEKAIVTGAANTAPVRRQPTGYANRWPIPSRRVGLSASYNW
ncbi:MAG: TonB-dependent receptor [Pseudomonadales bacterium]